MPTLRAAIAACGFAAAAALSSQPSFASQQPLENAVIVIDDVTLIDVENRRPIPHQTVTIVGERIDRIEESTKARLTEGANVISGKGLYLIPGLFDAHVHITTSAETFGPMLLANGVTACRDIGADTNEILALRERSHQVGAMLPHIICTGAIIDGVPPVWPFSEPCDTPDEARAAVRKLHAAGVDQIKVYSLLKPDVHRAAVEEAHALKMKATGHVPNSVTVAQAIEAGQDCVEHLTGFEQVLNELFVKPDNDRQGIWPGLTIWMKYPDVDKAKLRERLALVAKAGMTQCPTLVVMRGIGLAADPETANKDERMAYVPAGLRGFWSGGTYAEFGKVAGQVVPHMQSMVGEMHAAGVPLMIGTDLANPYVFAGFAVHDEMKLFQDAGIPAIDVLRSATIIPARFCGAENDLGSIAKGKFASLVLLQADPLESTANATKIQSVFVRGVHYDRTALDAMLQDVREIAAKPAPVAAAVDMSLHGEIVARGRYVMQFNGQFDAGVEDFVITKDSGDFLIRAYSQPQGGWSSPTVVTFRFSDSFAFKDASMKQMTDKPIDAKYVLTDGTLHATATVDNAAQTPQAFKMPERGIVTASLYAIDFAVFGAMRDLEVDEKRELQAVGFGMAGWQVAAAPYAITRKADEETTIGDGTKVNARHFTSVFSNQGMAINVDTWLDKRGVMVRSRIRAPFGTIDTVLATLKQE